MKLSSKLTIVGLAVTVAALLFGAGTAYATPGSTVIPQGTCTEAEAKAGRTGVAHNGDLYRCEQRTAEDRRTHCGHWHHVPKPGPHTSWSKRPPAPCPCNSANPSKSASASVSPSASKSPSPKPSASGSASAGATPPTNETPASPPAMTPAAAVLPITGTPSVVLGIAVTGALLVLGGAGLLIASLRRRT